MRPSRVLFFDFDGKRSAGDHTDTLLAPFMRSRPQVYYLPAFFIMGGERLKRLDTAVGAIDPVAVIVEAAETGSGATLAFVDLIRQTHRRLRLLLVAEQTHALILRLFNGEIGDTRIIPLADLNGVDLACLEDQEAGDRQLQVLMAKVGLAGLVGESERFMAEVRKIAPVAAVDATVLLTGETGTGKEGFARAIHYLSARRGGPFCPVNCGAIPHDLLENEFFGHEAGAYTGAASRQAGWIKESDGGTLFLDEVDTLPLSIQTKLLRFIQEREYKPLGSPHVNKADVRIIAATNIDLDLAVREGRFRQDLYYRLNIIPITLPPLRERPEDIPLLARHFLAKYSATFHKQVHDLTPEALALLMAHPWPGNVRQLEHAIECMVVFAGGDTITEDDVSRGTMERRTRESLRAAKSKAVADCEKSYIVGVLIANNGNVARAASAAKKHPRAFRQLIHKYAIDLGKYRTR